MFTSRAEFRLILREDNADLRLTPKGRELGLVGDKDWAEYEQRKRKVKREIKKLKNTTVQPGSQEALEIEERTKEKVNKPKNTYDLLKRPNINYIDILRPKPSLTKNEIDKIEAEIKYEGYIKRQGKEIERLQKTKTQKYHPTQHLQK